jgi:phospho-N-acetylmuramoyl-pentapeptide-transferase
MAPFHHHLEKAGWPEERIVARAWLLTALVTILTLAWVLSSPGSPGVLR